MTFRKYPNGFPQLAPVRPCASASGKAKNACHKTRVNTPPFSTTPPFHQSQALSPSLLRAYGRIYQRLGGKLRWQGDMPVLTPQQRTHFTQVRDAVAAGKRIEQAMLTKRP